MALRLMKKAFGKIANAWKITKKSFKCRWSNENTYYNGYWSFVDRHEKATDKYNYNEIFDGFYLNFSVTVFETDSNILYF